ncbi:MAG: NusG domain II-containing protein [Bacteroidales bacterium]|nr:NusG domain II-containing protein [Lachnoclostridium sp.]MCM1384993.1 NusG domain II-containing protein [Lachnoclostridium sp.]MCM1465881.1 NusG domain II-containing protein [Bacteroidales bacterium]
MKFGKLQGERKYITVAILMSLAILLLAFVCILWIFRPVFPKETVADIYQNGHLLQSIPLNAAKEPFSFTVTGENTCFNEITVKDGGICISNASCPDKLCMHQGYIRSSLLPITCLPNKLVIQIREIGDNTPDMITY